LETFGHCQWFPALKELGLADRHSRLVCAQAQQANPLYRSFLQNFESYGAITAGDLATAIQIGNPVSIHKASKPSGDPKGIVDQASEAELPMPPLRSIGWVSSMILKPSGPRR